MLFPPELRDLLTRPGQVRSVYKSGPATQAAVACGLLSLGRSVVVVVPGEAELAALRSLLDLFSPGGGAGLALPPGAGPWSVFPSYGAGRIEARSWTARWAALYGLAFGRGPRGALLTVDNLLAKWPAPEVLAGCSLELAKGQDMPPGRLLEQLAAWGYERVRMVTRPGEAALRGDILDVHPAGYDEPLRLEFFGDTLDGLRSFDPATQRSRQEVAQAVFLPATPSPSLPELLEPAAEKWRKHKAVGELSPQALEELTRLAESGGAAHPGLYYQDSVLLSGWLPQDAVWLLCGAGQLRTRLEEAEWDWSRWLEEEWRAGSRRWPRGALIQTAEGARKSWMDRSQVLFEDLTMGAERKGLDLPERALHEFAELFWKPEHKERPWHALVEAMKAWERERPQVLLSFRSEGARKKFLTLAGQEGVLPATAYRPDSRGLFALVSPLRKGFELAWSGALVLSEDVLQPRPAEARPGRDKAFKGLAEHDDLTPNDLLVHRDWGVCRFDSLTRLTVGSVTGDYLLLRFAGDDRLYLPVDRMNLVQRYKGPDGAAPALDRLGGASFARTKGRVRKALEKVAQELVEMYAYRRVAKGFAYGPLNELFWEFEASFGFEETPDQGRAIAEVLEDMGQSEPMDRLVCGDVGFGKTEVAMRAAFRAALDGKQVALLCPTTVLAEQHYQNFKRRLKDFPISVAMLSRFVTKERQKAVLAAAAKGRVDILIGTHRLLSKDVALPNLGLLVLDEEQRFGVKHKERLKQYRKTIDVLTLTATPIPRTLQLSLAGLRGLSVIETPPVDRKPVATCLIERDDAELSRIVQRELDRQGQVFWVHNRVQGLEEVVSYVRRLAPGARVGMAHGQMSERALEEAMHQFWHGELDILVCTAIIESGLDFPRANTLVVDSAHMFGLGQLYQLRGRVGRSERQAFACFVIPSLDHLPEPARKRLQVILDMDYLGAGFQIAMEDLRLRGAGNILGEAQSGVAAKVGLDLYLEMLEEEVRRQRGEGARAEHVEPELTIGFPARLPESYIGDSRERLALYKSLSSAVDRRALEEAAEEIRDRFGPLPAEAESFVAVLKLKRLLSRLRVVAADLYPGRAVLTWKEDDAGVDPAALLPWVSARPGNARLMPPARLELRIPEKGTIRESMQHVEDELGVLLPEAMA
ncbi:MAG: transcription-repair coupling factor [Thermodesulfobacteriota bacterium]